MHKGIGLEIESPMETTPFLLQTLKTTPVPLYYLGVVLGNLWLYLLLVVPTYFLVKRLKAAKSDWVITDKPFNTNNVRSEFIASIQSILLFGFNGVFLQIGYQQNWIQFGNQWTLGLGLFELLLLLLWNEVHFYFFHRLFHHSALYPWHFQHHKEPNVSPFAIFSFHWSEALALGSVIPMALMLYSFHLESIFLFVFASMIMNTVGHSGLNLFKNTKPGSFFRFAQRHFDHHKYHSKNYGFLLPWFDQVLKTEVVVKNKKTADNKTLLAFMSFMAVLLAFQFVKAADNKTTRLLEVNPRNVILPSQLAIPAGYELQIRSTGRKEVSRRADKGIRADALKARLSCDSDVKVLQAGRFFKGKVVDLYNFDEEVQGRNATINFTQSIFACELSFQGKISQIRPESVLSPVVANLRTRQNTCVESNHLWDCGYSFDSAKLLKDPYLALSSRFEALTGQPLSRADYEKKDPNMLLDFSRAPKLDLVIFDTLQIMNDFAGVTILKMLRHHAQQGAQVMMLTSKALLLPQEKILLKKFKEENPEIQLIIYQKPSDNALQELNPNFWLQRLHQASHVKALVTYSKQDPSTNRAIVGGRNQSEMYFYPNVPDNSAYPDIIQWNKQKRYNWAYFDDLDFEISNENLVADLANRLLRYNSMMYLESNQDAAAQAQVEQESSGSFYVSYPFAQDKGELTRKYIEMIDSAKTKLLIVSPYLNFPKEIKAALENAKAKGVAIQIITNISVENDFMPGILQPAMTKYARKIADDYDIHFYSFPPRALHIKGVVIDDQQLVLGSINWNQRSFLHDTEIAFVTNNRQMLIDFDQMLTDTIRPYSKKLTPDDLPPKTLMEFIVTPIMKYM